MKPYYQDNHITQYCMNFLDNDLLDESIQMVVTSPPYWGLRKYEGEQDLVWGGDKNCQHEFVLQKTSLMHENRNFQKGTQEEVMAEGRDLTHIHKYSKLQAGFCSLCGAWKGAYGLEPTPKMYVQHTVEILGEIRRVLRKDGVVFWNIGDSYASHAGGYSNNGSRGNSSVISPKTQAAVVKGKRIARGAGRWGGGGMLPSGYLKEKDLCLIPFRVALAAQADGWWVRSIIIWNKPNPMPESVTDRPTESHEYILMLTKSARYYWDADAVREKNGDEPTQEEYNLNKSQGRRSDDLMNYGMTPKGQESVYGKRMNHPSGRNIRSVWSFPTQPYPEAHFAVFPEKLPELCIKAATPEMGSCSKCGKPWERITEHKNMVINKTDGYAEVSGNRTATSGTMVSPAETKTIGWQPSCRCWRYAPDLPIIDGVGFKEPYPTVSATVLDPFSGAGTTLWVAKKLNRKAIGFDISEEYCELAVSRNRQQVLMG
ncbi:hypothetical protein LCGC14_0884480 [marine sediment metagenome]|uniref:site-specific DNA-methyltransferase (cytosine-N(4)-specific) n=1 Tax=marine sediment metagenome TaxID=412755 RepID=A0A0F9S7Z7_9ZZZZ